jgi:RHS repeat-associated protein
MADSNQNVITEYDYEPFGGTTATGLALTNSYKFTAREDDGTGLYYYRARYYHPALGRFVSEDLLGWSGVGNYVYCANNPVNFIDPLGLYDMTEADRRLLQSQYEGLSAVEAYIKIVELHSGIPKATYWTGGSQEWQNYTAGYSAGYAGSLGVLDWDVLRQFGRLYGLSASLESDEWFWSQIPFLGDDWISFREMTQGYLRGRWDAVFDRYPSQDRRGGGGLPTDNNGNGASSSNRHPASKPTDHS